MRGLRVEDERRALDVLLGRDRRGRADGLARLEVRLAVEVLRLEVAHVVRVRGREHDDVRRHLVVLAQEHDVADLELLPERALPAREAARALAVVEHAHGRRGVHGLLVRGERARAARPRVRAAAAVGLARRVAVRVDALDVVELAPRAVHAHAHVEAAVVHLQRAHARAPVAGLAQHDAPPLARLALAQPPHAARHAPRRVQAEQPLVPRARVAGLVRVPPVPELRDRRVVHLVVDERAPVVLDAVLDRGHGDDEDERQRGRLWRRCAEDGKDCRPEIEGLRTGLCEWTYLAQRQERGNRGWRRCGMQV